MVGLSLYCQHVADLFIPHIENKRFPEGRPEGDGVDILLVGAVGVAGGYPKNIEKVLARSSATSGEDSF